MTIGEWGRGCRDWGRRKPPEFFGPLHFFFLTPELSPRIFGAEGGSMNEFQKAYEKFNLYVKAQILLADLWMIKELGTLMDYITDPVRRNDKSYDFDLTTTMEEIHLAGTYAVAHHLKRDPAWAQIFDITHNDTTLHLQRKES